MYPNSELFICGALKNIGRYFMNNDIAVSKAVMQGGFIGYDTHGINVPKLEKFIGKEAVPTFNLNGDVKGAKAYLNARIRKRYFVSKNVCHTIIYDTEVHKKVMAVPARDRAAELFREGMTEYLKKHPQGKKFHDPAAAVCHLHPEIGTWVKAKLYREKGAWGSHIDGSSGDSIIVDIDYDKLWDYIARGV
jgi:pyrimidine-specific ribonucleoside hydrolase